MWSQIGLCLLVGIALASNNPGWKGNSEYVYSIRGRTLTSLREVTNQYSGILLKAQLRVQPRPDGKLNARIDNAQYAQVHSQLPDGWNTNIPDAELSYKPCGMSNKPFQIETKNGVIRELIVDKTVTNWEANIIKSIMSQFQLDANCGSNKNEQLSENSEGENSCVFRTMEETITGNTETQYDIHPLPEYTLEGEEWTNRLSKFGGHGDIIEIVKNKNYSNNMELPSYHYGFSGMGNWKPATNQMGDFFIRSSISRAILTGNLNRYTVQNSYTVNEIMVSPMLESKEKASVVSLVNVTLEDIKSQGQNIGDVPNPVRLGGLVYTFDDPFSNTQEAGQRKPEERKFMGGRNSAEYDRYQRSAIMKKVSDSHNNIEDEYAGNNFWHTTQILRRSSNQEYPISGSGEPSEYWQTGAFYKQDQPQLSEVPQFPLLPYTTGFYGKSIKQDKNTNIPQSIKKIAQSIGNDLQNPDSLLRQNTLNKFTIMTSLIRIMNKDEIQLVASELYSQSTEGPQSDTWAAFRDAVAEAGTGPAFLTIQHWIESKKIKGNEAAQIVGTMTRAVRVPTAEFMQSYFNFIKKPEVQSQEYLNDTALTSFASLIRQVYIDSKLSRNEFPVKSFGSFRTEEGKKITKDVISYLTKQLHEAISRGDAPQIHVYICALGHIGHPDILSAFEPYLEGDKQASQYQRLLMVVAMGKLAESDPEAARLVLFNVYQNAGETQEVRVAAVYQLMRTNPPTSMLQRMAFYTNIDTHEYVNSAVKSSIESAAELEGDEYSYVRSSARAAKPLLTRKTYGLQHGANHLRNYVMQELSSNLKQTVQSMGNEEGFYPKGLQYSVHANLGGIKSQLVKIKAMASSIQELIHVAKLQTASYQQQREEQQRNANEQQQQQFSSQKIAQTLKLEGDEREQLEGDIYMEFDSYFQRIISFDNHTVRQFPEVIRKLEEELKNGKGFHFTKFTNAGEMAMSFPTETGLPCLFTYDTPALVKAEGKLKGVASPQASDGNKLRQLDTVSVQSNVDFTVNSQIQSQLCFFTPFDHQKYISGFDKNFQVHAPFHGNVKIDIKNRQVTAEIDPKDWHKNGPSFHYSTWPYTSRTDIKNFQPVSLQQNTHYIYQPNLRTYDKVFGQKETGMAWHVKIHHKRHSVTISWLHHLLHKQGVFGGLLNLWDDSSIQHREINVRYLADKSSARKCVVHVGFQQEYRPQSKGEGSVNPAYWSQYSQVADLSARQTGLMDKLGAGINSADLNVAEASVEFQGEKNIKYTVAGGYGKSNVDPKSRVLGWYKKSCNNPDVKPYEIALEAINTSPNTNALDLRYSLEHEPKVDSEFNVRFGQTPETCSEINGKMAFRRSEKRKRYLQEQPLYQQCQREMRKGDYHLPACANVTMSSNLLDKVDIEVKYDKVKPDVADAVEAVYNALRVNYYPSIEFKNRQGGGKQNQINMQAEFDPDLRAVNFTVKTNDEESTVNNIKVGEWGRTLLVAHPVFHARSRIMGNIFGLQTYRPFCVVDQTSINTFDNKTYSANISKRWTVVLQYVPKEGRHGNEPWSVQQQLMYQTENYAVLVRQNPQSNKGRDFKITFSSPETSYKLKDITLNSAQGQGSGKVKVTVNGQGVSVSDKHSYDIGDGFVQIYSLPNGEVKVEIRNAFYVISDGQRAKLTVLNGKFRSAVRGLCGTFNDEKASDFLTPRGCIVRNSKTFIESYDIESGERGPGQSQKQCFTREVPLYANVITSSGSASPGISADECITSQTRYVEQSGQICFTVREMPVCSPECRARSSYTKTVSVHCVKNSNAAQVWKDQIDRGLSPSFGHKQATKSIQIELPHRCEA